MTMGAEPMRALAVVIAGALVAGAILVVGRYQIVAAPGQVFRLDRWAGTVKACNAPLTEARELVLVMPGADLSCSR